MILVDTGGTISAYSTEVHGRKSTDRMKEGNVIQCLKQPASNMTLSDQPVAAFKSRNGGLHFITIDLVTCMYAPELTR